MRHLRPKLDELYPAPVSFFEQVVRSFPKMCAFSNEVMGQPTEGRGFGTARPVLEVAVLFTVSMPFGTGPGGSRQVGWKSSWQFSARLGRNQGMCERSGGVWDLGLRRCR